MALTPWLGVIVAIVLISLFHQTMTSVAEIMLIVSVLTVFAAGIPALVALARASTRESGINVTWNELSPADLDLTLVVPFSNRGTHFGSHIGEVMETLSKSGFTYEVLVVSDESTGPGENRLTTIAEDHLRFVHLDLNQGKAATLRAGLSLGRGEYLGFIEERGYDRPRLWLSDGWATACAQGWGAPLYWFKHDDGDWRIFTLNGVKMLDPGVTFADMYIFKQWQLTKEPAILIGMDALGVLDTLVIDYRRHELQLRTMNSG